MSLGPLNLIEGKSSTKYRVEQFTVFASHCNNAIKLAKEVDPYHVDVIKSLRAAIEMKGIKNVKRYIDRYAKEESVCFVLNDAADFIEENRDMCDSEIAYELNQIQEVLTEEISILYGLPEKPYVV